CKTVVLTKERLPVGVVPRRRPHRDVDGKFMHARGKGSGRFTTNRGRAVRGGRPGHDPYRVVVHGDQVQITHTFVQVGECVLTGRADPGVVDGVRCGKRGKHLEDLLRTSWRVLVLGGDLGDGFLHREQVALGTQEQGL